MRRLLLLLLLAGCAAPPPSAYVGGRPQESGSGIDLGTNAAGERCRLLPAGESGSGDIYCADARMPAAQVARAGKATAEAEMALATSSPFRAGLDLRLVCDAPKPTTILGSTPAALLVCTRRVGGWPQAALVTVVDGTAYQAEGILPALAVMERAIGVLSGRITAAAAPALSPSAADALLGRRLAAHAFGAGTVDEYDRLMALGARANLSENFAEAERADRAALAIQQKALGLDNPDSVAALVHLALQLSDQGRFAEADRLFAQADLLAYRAADPVAPPRLAHYRALHALNQERLQEALALLDRAERAYSALLPPDTLAARPVAAVLPDPALLADPTSQSALLGLVDTRRYRAIVLRLLGRPAESEAAITSARTLARTNDLLLPLVSSRLWRTEGTVSAAGGQYLAAETGLARSVAEFGQVLPETRPVAETELLRAGEYMRQGAGARALDHCRAATALLRRLGAGVDPRLLLPCLAAFAAEADHAGAGASSATLRGEMFETAQLAQDSITSRQIDEAAVRLAAGARDPKVGQAIRRRQDASEALAALYGARDAATARAGGTGVPGSVPPGDPGVLDKRIVAAEAELADADAALQEAAPNYGQLVQRVVPTSAVLAALAPGEAFAAVILAGEEGWTFLLRNGVVHAGRVPGGLPNVTGLIRRVRAGIEPAETGLPRFDMDAASALYAAVLGPVASALEGTTALIVAPTGPLLALPFGLLLTEPPAGAALTDAPWLIRRMSVSHVPAAVNFVALRKIAGGSRATRPWFGFGDFRPVSMAQAERSFPAPACADSARLLAGLPPLPFARRELDAARRLTGAAASDQLLGAALTVPAIRHADLRSFRILHFATHALLPTDLKCLDQAAIVTSPPAGARDAAGALLTDGEVIGLDLDADMVILSACNTGGPGGRTAGESLSGLARGFFFAGARGLMVTHWSIDDQASAFLVADTLRRFASGVPLAAAVRATQLGMIGDPGLAHPFYWAAFAVVGAGG